MEEKRDYRQQNIQKFYFNDEGKLVVESNKGVWVDGEQHVKMYGNFSCNAKTMGIIISQLKGMPAFISIENSTTNNYFGLTECLINPSAEQAGLLSKISERDAIIEEKTKKIENHIKYIAELQKKIGEDGDKIYKLKRSIREFNALPWYKRIFKKIEIQTN